LISQEQIDGMARYRRLYLRVPVLLHFYRCRLLRQLRRSDAILQGFGTYDFPVSQERLERRLDHDRNYRCG